MKYLYEGLEKTPKKREMAKGGNEVPEGSSLQWDSRVYNFAHFTFYKKLILLMDLYFRCGTIVSLCVMYGMTFRDLFR